VTRRGRRVDRLAVEVEVGSGALEFAEQAHEVLPRAAEAVDRPGPDDVDVATRHRLVSSRSRPAACLLGRSNVASTFSSCPIHCDIKPAASVKPRVSEIIAGQRLLPRGRHLDPNHLLRWQVHRPVRRVLIHTLKNRMMNASTVIDTARLA